MPELTPMDKLQPCLLDRLTDDAPHSAVESRTQRVVSLQRYKEGVLRDLRWLLNTASHLPEEGLSEFPEAQRSVLNFGSRQLSGLMSESLNLADLERQLAEAIHLFEPRIIRQSLSVKIVKQPDQNHPHLISFEIRGHLWARPMPEQLYIKTEIDLETGDCVLRT